MWISLWVPLAAVVLRFRREAARIERRYEYTAVINLRYLFSSDDCITGVIRNARRLCWHFILFYFHFRLVFRLYFEGVI